MAVIINNVPGQTIQEQINKIHNIQSKKPYPCCNVSDIPGKTAKERINEIQELKSRKNQVPGDTFSLSGNNSKVQNKSFLEKLKKLFN